MKIEIPYYEDNSRISNSAIGWFLKKGPRYLKDMLDGKEEGLSAKYLEKGTMIHMYLLQPEEFWDNYIILDYEKPKSPQQIAFCESFVSSSEFVHEDKLVDAYKKAYTCKGLATDAIIKKAEELIREAAGKGADIIQVQELFETPYFAQISSCSGSS